MADRLIRSDSASARAYMVRAWAHLYRSAFDHALSDHRRALSLNPNLAANLFAMAWTEAVMGLTADARNHAHAAIRLSPREAEIWLSEGHAALALVSYLEGDDAEARRWGHLSGQMQPILQSVLAGANARLGDIGAAQAHVAAIEGFAPDFIPAVLAGRIRVCRQDAHNELLVEGLRLASTAADETAG